MHRTGFETPDHHCIGIKDSPKLLMRREMWVCQEGLFRQHECWHILCWRSSASPCPFLLTPALLLVLSSRQIIAVGNWHLLFQVILPKTAQLLGMAMRVSTISPWFPWQLRPSWWGDMFSWSKHTQIKSHKITEEKIRKYAESLRVLYVYWSPPDPGWQINVDLLYTWIMIACGSGWERQHIPHQGCLWGRGKY